MKNRFMSNDDAFWSYWNREWWETPLICPRDEAKKIFNAGRNSVKLPEIIAAWNRVRQDINTDSSRELDRLLLG